MSSPSSNSKLTPINKDYPLLKSISITRSFILAYLVIITSSQIIHIDCLDNGLAKTPPMGWISWERFTCNTDCNKFPDDCVNEVLYKKMADSVAEDGWLDAGYEYVNIDDCWSELKRNESNQQLIASHDRFPNGIGQLADYIHSKGVKFGIYGDCGTLTCGGYPAQLKDDKDLTDNYMSLDANLFANWKIDSFKFDNCNLSPDKAEYICPSMVRAINQTGRSMMLICEWPFYMMRSPYHLKPNFTLVAEACNTWRYFEDVEDSWLSILSIIDFSISLQSTIVKHHGPGHWFDPDQLVIGNFGLSLDQARAQMAIWCLWSAPLYMGNDLRNIDIEMAGVLKNKQLIAVNQDKLGIFGQMVSQSDNRHEQAFVKPVAPIKNGCPSFVIVYLNRATLGNIRKLSFKLRDILSRAPIQLAATRHSSLYSNSSLAGGKFDASECEKLIEFGMTREPRDTSWIMWDRNSGGDNRPVEEKKVSYKMVDLFNDPLEKALININENLELDVNPSGVRVVKLIATSD